jgi:multiple sugar transport system permease protein
MRYHKTPLLFLTPFLTVFVAFYLAPVFYAIYLSLFIKKRIGVGPPKEVFGGLENYIRAVQDSDFLNGLKNIFVDLFAFRDGIFVRWFGNSLLYAGSISVGSTLICALGGYAFAKYDFPGKHFLFNFILGAIMVPSTALVLPLFLMLYRLGLVNSIWGGILPSRVNPFGLYLMRVFWNASFPNDLIEAARLDGAGELRIFWYLGMPLMQTGLVTVALLSFVGAWNNFFLPLIVLSDDNLYPLTLGLNIWNSVSNAAGGGKPSYHLIALGSLISVLPLIAAFILLGKYWRGGLTAGATK